MPQMDIAAIVREQMEAERRRREAAENDAPPAPRAGPAPGELWYHAPPPQFAPQEAPQFIQPREARPINLGRFAIKPNPALVGLDVPVEEYKNVLNKLMENFKEIYDEDVTCAGTPLLDCHLGKAQRRAIIYVPFAEHKLIQCQEEMGWKAFEQTPYKGAMKEVKSCYRTMFLNTLVFIRVLEKPWTPEINHCIMARCTYTPETGIVVPDVVQKSLDASLWPVVKGSLTPAHKVKEQKFIEEFNQRHGLQLKYKEVK